MTPEVPALLDSFLHAIRWWLALAVLHAIGWIVIRDATGRWHDRGWSIAGLLALLAFAWVFWAAAHVLPVFQPWAIRLLVAGTLLGLLLARRPLRLDRASLRALAWAEARFVLPFAFYLAMRGASHDVIGLEKFMDFGFVAGALRADSVPVADPWFAGEPINYYYFGHFVTAFLCKLAGTPAAFGYNLMLATLFGMTFRLSWAFVREMTAQLEARVRNAMAMVAATWLTLGGNVHGFIYGFIRPWMVDAGLVEPPRQAFLLSDPTRFVGWNPPTEDKLIHEFPAYAFYVGDLHAHLLNLPFVLLFICIVLAWLRARRHEPHGREQRSWLLCAGGLVGVFAMSNSWDAAMYAAFLAALLMGGLPGAWRRGARATLIACIDGLAAGLASVVVAAPFLLAFCVHTEGFFPTHTSTPLWQWLVLYGLQAIVAILGCLAAWRHGDAITAQAERKLLYAMTLFGIAFALLPEFVYLKDIYGGAYYRGNTAFKFGFQAFTLLTLAATTGIALLLTLAARSVRLPRTAIVIALQLVLVPPLYYAWFVLQGAFGVWNEREWTLDGQRYLALTHPEDRAASAWLLANAGKGNALVEAVGDSYTYAARLSANTGIPAVLGWPVHEQLWRGSDPAVWTRRDDVNRFYESASTADLRKLVEQYGARWIVVGRYERERYGEKLDIARLHALGKVVFRSGETFIVDATQPPD